MTRRITRRGTRRTRRTASTRLGPLLVLVACLFACAAPPARKPGLAVWSEYLPLATVEAQLPFLRAHDLEVNLGLTRGQVDWTALARLLRAAADQGVPIHLWPELSAAEGRWPNARNLALFVPWWREVIAQVEREQLAVTTLVVDLELSWQVQEDAKQAFAASGDPFQVLDTLVARIDDAAYAAAKAELRALVEQTQAQGYRVRLTTLPMILDDFADGDETVQKVLDIPVEGIPWDEVSFQVYRGVFNEVLAGSLLLPPGASFGPYLVYDYGLSAREAFGDRATLDLGTVGGVGYQQPQRLAEDIGAALAAGYARATLDIYSLDGILAQPEPERWLDLAAVTPTVPPLDRNVDKTRALLRTLDASIAR